jgi:hypothetical protein
MCCSHFSFLVIFGAFSSDFRGGFWRRFFAVFGVGVTHDEFVPLCLVALLLQTRGKLSDLVVFVGARVLEVWSRDLRFPVIESVLVQFL